MTTQFITNQQKLLSDVANKILPSSENLYFLVGYFYFSGFQELYKNLKDKHLKLLVGLEIQTDLANRIKELEVIQEVRTSRGAIRESFNQSLIELFNDTDFFDSTEKQEAFRLFIEKLKNGTLEIRKTLHPNHAKLYLFENKQEHNQGGEFPGTVITGSSNLTRSGLREQFEINVISREGVNYREAYTIFQQLWKDSVLIADKSNLNDFLNNVIEKVWIEKLPKPFLLFVRVLEEYFSIKGRDQIRLPGEITRGKFIDLKYQVDAVQKAIDILENHHGVIIADVVGLGKSIIASAIAYNLGLKTVIVAPPHLEPQWKDYAFDFDYTAKIYTSGKIEEALSEIDDEPKLIIIDEAHKYRNELTEDYANLHKLCQKNKVVLLSATPFNNRPQDVFSMVKLFQLPTHSTIQTVDNLSHQFRTLIVEYKNIQKAQKEKSESKISLSLRIRRVADDIRKILYPLVIRRSRLDLQAIDDYWQDLQVQAISFPKVHEPELLDYELGSLSELYEKTLIAIAPDDNDKGRFIGARYKPSEYILKDYRKLVAERMGTEENLLRQGQANLADFMKRLLVRRFESSMSAFHSTLKSMIQSSQVILDWYEKFGKVPIYKKGRLPDIDSLIDSTGEDLDDELDAVLSESQLKKYIDKGLVFIDKSELDEKFVRDVKKDIARLKNIEREWFGDSIPHDPKLARFAAIIQEKLKEQPDRKIVVFTEFADTADYLYGKLKKQFRAFKYAASDASKANKEIIRQNFDAGYKMQVNDYDLLIATDAISEGFNLHRAGIVFNYDIPYNPTRVIQRVGRINRINKKVFDNLYIYNFFPTATGEREIRIGQISSLKIAMVHALFGEDTKVLTKDEELQSFFAEQFRRDMAEQEELSPEAPYENLIRNLRSMQPALIKEAAKIPKRCRVCRTVKKARSGVLLFGKKGQEYAFKFGSQHTEPAALSPAEAFALFEAQIAENADPVSKAFEPVYKSVKEKLFSRKTAVAMDKAKRDTIQKIEALKDKLPDKKDYLEDLLHVVQELDALPERFGRLIRAVEWKSLEQDFADLIREIPHSYLSNIIDRQRQIEEGKESLIVSEELI